MIKSILIIDIYSKNIKNYNQKIEIKRQNELFFAKFYAQVIFEMFQTNLEIGIGNFRYD